MLLCESEPAAAEGLAAVGIKLETLGGAVTKIVYVDMDNVLVDFRSGKRRLPPAVRREFKDHLDDAPGIFALMGDESPPPFWVAGS
jgi:hypothetical protein